MFIKRKVATGKVKSPTAVKNTEKASAPSAQRGKSKVSIKGKIPTEKVKCPIAIKDTDEKALLKRNLKRA